MEEITDYKLVLDTAVLAGQIMLQNGAEIHRVEDTIYRILKVSNLKTAEAYVTPTGLIVTLDDPGVDSMTVVKRIETRGTNLSKIAEVNSISRQFCSGSISLKEAFHRLKYMKLNSYAAWQKYVSQVLVAASFAILLGGSFRDAVGAGVAGICMGTVMFFCRKIDLNNFLQLLLDATVISLTAFAASHISWFHARMDIVIIGGIMPIVPGAALTTAVRDTLQGNYVAGGAKALEAFVSAAAIAAGVALGMLLTGGVG